MSKDQREHPADNTDSFAQREAAARQAMVAIASEIASSPNLKPLALHLGNEVLKLMVEGHTQVLADLMQQDPEVFLQPPMDQLTDHAFNILFPHMDREAQVAFGRAVVEQATGRRLEG